MSNVRGVILLFSIFLMWGCKKVNRVPADTLVIGIAAAPQTLDPRFSTDATGMKIAKLIFSSLVRMDADLNITGDAAASWDYKDSVFHFQLKPGLKFSNGEPVTDADLLFSFDEYKKSSNPFSQAFSSIQKVESQYSVESGGTLKLYLSSFSAALITDLTTLKILPKKIVTTYDKDFYQHLVGAGPFVLETMADNEIRLKRRSDLPPSTLTTLQFKIIRDDNSRFLKMYKGDLDIVQSDMPLAKIKVFKNSPRFEVHENAGLSMTYLLLNLRDPLLKQLPVRQAMDLAIDRKEIIEHKLEGLAIPATSLLTPGNPFFDASIPSPRYDIEKAKQLLANVDKNHLFVLKTSNQAAAVENGKVIAFQLNKLGLQVQLKSFEWGTYYEDIKKGQFEMATMRWVGTTDPDIYRLAFHSQQLSPAGRNRGFYVNPDLDPLLTSGVAIEDQKQRIEHYKNIQKMVAKDLPIIPLWYDKQVSIVNKRVKNYKLPINGDFSFALDVEKTAENPAE